MGGDVSGVQSTSHISNWRDFIPQNLSKSQISMVACLKFLPWESQIENPQSKLNIKIAIIFYHQDFSLTERLKESSRQMRGEQTWRVNPPTYTYVQTHIRMHNTHVHA